MMADLGEIQRKLDSDRAVYLRYLSDPVGVLAEHGVILSRQQAFELQHSIMMFFSRKGRNEAASLARESRDG
jgi:hypothetical protein